MPKHKYIESPEILRPDLEFEMPFKMTKDGFYQFLPNRRHIGCKNQLRKRHQSLVKSGYVYFIKIKDTSKFKIGVSTNPKRRLSDISSVIPFDLEILAVNFIKEPYEFEQSIIDKFKGDLIRNEWFDLNISQAKYIMISLHNKQVKDSQNG